MAQKYHPDKNPEGRVRFHLCLLENRRLRCRQGIEFGLSFRSALIILTLAAATLLCLNYYYYYFFFRLRDYWHYIYLDERPILFFVMLQ